MAVDAQHLNLFPSQLILNKEVMNLMNNTLEGNNVTYNNGAQMGYGGYPISSTKIESSSFLPIYNPNSAVIPNKSSMKDDSGLTSYYTLPRKRLRDDYSNNSINQQPPISIPIASSSKGYRSNFSNGSFSFMGEDFSSQVIQQQLDIDLFISQHMDKVRMGIEERRKRSCRRVVEVVEEGILKRLRAKEEEIEKISKLNWALEERVKSLAVENQIWRDLAQTNEATANALRTNLEDVLAQVKDVRTTGAGLDEAAELNDDAQSCCGSNGGNDLNGCDEVTGWRTLAGGDGRVVKDKNDVRRRCRNCGKGEARVLLLPCRHLCLCTVCGSSLHTCPVCKAHKDASVHVNMS